MSACSLEGIFVDASKLERDWNWLQPQAEGVCLQVWQLLLRLHKSRKSMQYGPGPFMYRWGVLLVNPPGPSRKHQHFLDVFQKFVEPSKAHKTLH
jgi:hypothetical protein